MFEEFSHSPREDEKGQIRRAANFVGAILSALLVGLFAVQLIDDLLPVGLVTNNVGVLAYDMLASMLYTVVPVLAVALIVRPGINPFPLRRVPRGTYPLAIFGGMALSLIANIVSNIIVQFLVSKGVSEPHFQEVYDPSVLNLVLNLVSSAVIPAVFEEITMRGYVLGALRPYGDKMALIVSSALFGLIHGNIKQIPFAFVLGLVLAWLTVQTNSILPAVVLHFTNNATVIVSEWLGQFVGGSSAAQVLVFTLFCLLGAVVMMVVFLQNKPLRQDLFRPVGNGISFLSVGERTLCVLTAPAFILGGGAWIALATWLILR